MNHAINVWACRWISPLHLNCLMSFTLRVVVKNILLLYIGGCQKEEKKERSFPRSIFKSEGPKISITTRGVLLPELFTFFPQNRQHEEGWTDNSVLESTVWRDIRNCTKYKNRLSDRLEHATCVTTRAFIEGIIFPGNTSLDWQVKTTYSWCGLSGRMSPFKTILTGVPSLSSPPPSLLFFSRSFLLRTAPHYLNAWHRLTSGYSEIHSEIAEIQVSGIIHR